MVNSVGAPSGALSEFIGDSIAAPTRNDHSDRIAGHHHRSPDRARQSVFARNPGDGPEAAAEYAVSFPAYRMDRASARVNEVVNFMQAPRPWDFKDERRHAHNRKGNQAQKINFAPPIDFRYDSLRYEVVPKVNTRWRTSATIHTSQVIR